MNGRSRDLSTPPPADPARPGGLNRVVWDLQAEKAQQLGNADDLPEFVPAGEYEVKITAGDLKGKTTVKVLPAPGEDQTE